MRYFPKAFLCIILLATACTYTQKVKDGRFAFERKQYSLAVQLLQKEYEKQKSRVEKGNTAFLIGESLRNMNRPLSASQWYKTAYDNGYGVDALREYAYSLKAAEQYEEAMQIFKELGIEIGSPYEYRREIAACKVALGWLNEKTKAYTVAEVGFNTIWSEYSPVPFRNDELVFTSDRKAATGEESYLWTGNDFSDLFLLSLPSENVKPLPAPISTEANEGTASFDAEFKKMVFTRCIGNKGEDQHCQLMLCTRNGDQWTTPEPLPFQQQGINYGHPALSADGNTLYFSCNSKDGWGGYDIWVTTFENSSWNDPKPLSRIINTIGNEKFPWLDGDTLYFASDWHTGMGGLDIFKTWRMANGAWVPVQNLKPPINSGSDDFGLSIDRRATLPEGVLFRGYFSSNRPGGSGSDDIYQFERVVLPPESAQPEPVAVDYKLVLNGYVLEKIFADADNPDSKLLGRKPLANAYVKVFYGKRTKTFTTSDDGFFSFELEENQEYVIQASKEGYLKSETRFSTVGVGKDPNNPVQTFEVELVLDKIYLNKEIVLKDIYYDFDKWDIRPDARPTLDELARLLELNPNIRIMLASHTDCRGSERYNQELSQKRAQAAVDYLISKGIDPDRLTAMGFGESQPKATCPCARCTEEEHQMNRRTTFTILE